ncbi:MAG: hypothetical protein MJ133_08815 [Lachnospiraceae bacterium]|nr:hypothetical protein [Lachnospiraceae bacterium]
MLNRDNFNIFNYIKKEEYIGSMDGMRYMLRKAGDEMEVVIWPEPYSYAHTSEDLKIKKMFPFSNDGVLEACDYLNEQYISQKELWELSKKY